MRRLASLDFIKDQLDVEFINLLGSDRIEVKFRDGIFIYDYFFTEKTDILDLYEIIKKDYFVYLSECKNQYK